MLTVEILMLDASAHDVARAAAVLAEGGVDARIDQVVDRAGFIAALNVGAFQLIIADGQADGFAPGESFALTRVSRPATPFVYWSSVVDAEQVVDAMKAGAADYIAKDNLGRLAARVTGVIEAAVAAPAHPRTESQLRTLVGELRHRLKNTLAAVSALNWLTRKNSQTLDQFHTAFTGRIEALSQAHELLFETTWKSAALETVLQRALKPFLGRVGAISMQGDAVEVSPKHALGLVLVIHELATNAVKYGALGHEEGTVAIRWTVSPDPRRRTVLTWTERGGPAVATPLRTGFGSTLIRRTVTDELGGVLDVRYPAEGLVCSIAFHDDPVEWDTADLGLQDDQITG